MREREREREREGRSAEELKGSGKTRGEKGGGKESRDV
jgi:hypothetical protein